MDVFSALADPNRRHIIELIALNGKLTASEISDRFHVSAPAISQHLKVLREARLVDMEKNAQQRIYTINTQALQEIEDWTRKMQVQWEDKFSRLDALLEAEKARLK